MATPQVAGIAGVLKAAHPEYKPAQVTARIKQTAVDYGKKDTTLYLVQEKQMLIER